jgi:hypothetical protein
MTYYWQVTVQFERENDNGRIQKIKENYLVDAMSGTEAEAKTYAELEQRGEMQNDVRVVSLKQSNIIRVF